MGRALSSLLLLLMIGVGWQAWQSVVPPTGPPAGGAVDRRAALWDPAASNVARIQAVEAWAEMGGAAVPRLMPGLQHADARIRGATAIALGRIGADALSALPELTKLLTDEDERVREYSAFAISGFLKTGIPEAAQSKLAAPLFNLLSDENPSTRSAGSVALLGLGDAALAPHWELTVQRGSVARFSIVDLLAARPRPLPDAVPVLVRMLSDDVAGIRMAALRVLRSWQCCPGPPLLPLVSSDSLPDRVAGWEALMEVTELPGGLLPHVAAALDSELHNEQVLALQVAGRLGPAAGELSAPILKKLARLSDDVDPKEPWLTEMIRKESLHALDHIGCDEDLLLPAVRRSLEDPRPEVAGAAAEILVARRPDEARRLVPELIEDLQTGEPPLIHVAGAILAAFGPLGAEAEPALLDTLAIELPAWAHMSVLDALRQIEPRGETAAAALQAFIERTLESREYLYMTARAIEVLETMGPRGAAAVPLLVRIVRAGVEELSPDDALAVLGDYSGSSIRTAAVKALARCGATFSDTYQTIELVYLDGTHNLLTQVLRPPALRSLAALSESGQARRVLLERAALDPFPPVRAAAAELMGEDHEHQDVWIPRLFEMLEDPEGSVRAAAAVALSQLRPGEPDVSDALKRIMSHASTPDEYWQIKAALVEMDAEG